MVKKVAALGFSIMWLSAKFVACYLHCCLYYYIEET